jgi:hypothetical protein
MQYVAKSDLSGPLIQFVARSLLMVMALMLVRPAVAQQPSPEQISAIRSSCRADYQAHCASVQPGGPEALACPKKNIAALSPPCQRAVGNVGAAPAQGSSAAAPAAPSAAAAPTAAAATPAASAAMGAMPARPPMPPRMQLAMLRQACAIDYRVNCAGVPLGGGRAIACLAANPSRLSPGCQRALLAAKGSM